MAYLRDTDNAARLALIDDRGVELLSAWRSRLHRGITRAAISGQLGSVAGHPAAVYLAGGRLWMAIDHEAWHLDEVEAEINDSVHVSIRTPRHSYAEAVEGDALDDTTAFTDPEDSSFALWVARIILDAKRQRVLREVLRDTSLEHMPEHASETTRRSGVKLRWRQPGHILGEDGQRNTE